MTHDCVCVETYVFAERHVSLNTHFPPRTKEQSYQGQLWLTYCTIPPHNTSCSACQLPRLVHTERAAHRSTRTSCSDRTINTAAGRDVKGQHLESSRKRARRWRPCLQGPNLEIYDIFQSHKSLNRFLVVATSEPLSASHNCS